LNVLDQLLDLFRIGATCGVKKKYSTASMFEKTLYLSGIDIENDDAVQVNILALGLSLSPDLGEVSIC
jgi:hypothetical protein